MHFNGKGCILFWRFIKAALQFKQIICPNFKLYLYFLLLFSVLNVLKHCDVVSQKYHRKHLNTQRIMFESNKHYNLNHVLLYVFEFCKEATNSLVNFFFFFGNSFFSIPYCYIFSYFVRHTKQRARTGIKLHNVAYRVQRVVERSAT